MSNLRILITGAGIAGPTLAFWLARAGTRVTIVERAPALRAVGQNVDIRGAGLEVIRRMGLEDTIRQNTTNEEGVAFVDANNRIRAQFGIDHSGKGKSFTSDTEILRGTLANILYEGTKEKVEYIFGDYVKSVDETDHTVQVTFANSTPQREFDLLSAGDGLGSPTRALIFPDAQNSCIRSLNQWTSYFSIPHQESDGALARWYNAPGRRCIFTRPNGAGRTMVFLSIMGASDKLHNHSKLSPAEQKELMHELFADAGWEASRVLAGMDHTDDFYMSATAQVKLPSWSKGRMGVVGDAAYCPSPISGMGTSVAIVGAYVLAGEIAKWGDDYGRAFEGYERLMRPYVDKAQKLPPGAPAIANPETAWGISVLNGVLGFVSWSGLPGWGGLVGRRRMGLCCRSMRCEIFARCHWFRDCYCLLCTWECASNRVRAPGLN